MRIWEDGLWRLSTLTHGEEAATFGAVLARAGAALKATMREVAGRARELLA